MDQHRPRSPTPPVDRQRRVLLGTEPGQGSQTLTGAHRDQQHLEEVAHYDPNRPAADLGAKGKDSKGKGKFRRTPYVPFNKGRKGKGKGKGHKSGKGKSGQKGRLQFQSRYW